jgi:hypothetical protein
MKKEGAFVRRFLFFVSAERVQFNPSTFIELIREMMLRFALPPFRFILLSLKLFSFALNKLNV